MTSFYYRQEVHADNDPDHLDLLKGKFSSGIEGALVSALNHDFNCRQLSEIILCIFFLCLQSLFE